MAGLGSPCGACKFLRRKCAGGCIFAPYFCHEEGAAHFAAVHKVFGASNASKLLARLPVSDRAEAALSISYEAQARLHDPVYGCVAHIFALQQQVVTLEAQLASLKAQTARDHNSCCGCSSLGSRPRREDRFDRELSPWHPREGSMNQPSISLLYNGGVADSTGSLLSSRHCDRDQACSFVDEFNSSCAMSSLDMPANATRRPVCLDTEDLLQSVAFGHLNCERGANCKLIDS